MPSRAALYGSLMALAAASVLVGCSAEDLQSGLVRGAVVLGGEHRFDAEAPVRGALVVLAGDVAVEGPSAVDGAMYVVGGQVSVAGEIAGDVAAVGGRLTLTDGAVVQGDLSSVGGELIQAPGAQVLGERVEGVQMPTSDAGGSLGRRVVVRLLEYALLAVAAYALFRYRPAPVQRIALAATRYPWVSGAVGLLTGVVGLVLVVLVAFTVLLIPVAFLGVAALVVAVAYGWIALGVAVAEAWTSRQPSRDPDRPSVRGIHVAAGSLAVAVGLEVVSLVPYVGDLLALTVTTVGFGAVILTRFGLVTFVPTTGGD